MLGNEVCMYEKSIGSTLCSICRQLKPFSLLFLVSQLIVLLILKRHLDFGMEHEGFISCKGARRGRETCNQLFFNKWIIMILKHFHISYASQSSLPSFHVNYTPTTQLQSIQLGQFNSASIQLGQFNSTSIQLRVNSTPTQG